MKKIALITLLLLITLNSCKSDETEKSLTKTELLTSEVWNGVSQKVYTEGVLTNTVDTTNQKLELLTDYSYKEYVDDLVDAEGSWSLSDNEETIDLFGDETFILNEVTSSKLVFTLNTVLGGNQTEVIYKYNK